MICISTIFTQNIILYLKSVIMFLAAICNIVNIFSFFFQGLRKTRKFVAVKLYSCCGWYPPYTIGKIYLASCKWIYTLYVQEKLFYIYIFLLIYIKRHHNHNVKFHTENKKLSQHSNIITVGTNKYSSMLKVTVTFNKRTMQ